MKKVTLTPSSAAPSEKERKFQAVAEAIFRILLTSGPPNVNHTAISRLSKVSRAWIYKYIGKSSDDLIHFSLDAIGKGFAKLEGLSRQNTPDEVRTSLFQGTWRMIGDAAREPALLALYYRYAGTQSSIGMKITDLEEIYLATVRIRLEKMFGIPTQDAHVLAEVLQGMRMGLAHRFAVMGLSKQAEQAEILKSIRRIMKHFHIEDEKERAKRP